MMRQPFERQLLKFTNAMHGWQNSCCFLDSAKGEPRYYLRCGVKAVKPRGMLNLPNAEFIPSKHYSLTYSVIPCCCDVYRFVAQVTKSKYEWISGL
uniref:PH domain-containing protein n=1 Tax=Trichuris muris TaxID=70415 RepID=A0A5S6QBD9_TRIMR